VVEVHAASVVAETLGELELAWGQDMAAVVAWEGPLVSVAQAAAWVLVSAQAWVLAVRESLADVSSAVP